MKTMAAYIEASGQRLSRQEQIERVIQDFDCIQIIRIEHTSVGMMKLVQKPTEWKLVQIQMVPELQGSGIGSSILEVVITQAKTAGVPLRLSVLKVNPAKRLYDRLGFVVLKEKQKSFEMSIDSREIDANG